MKNGMGEDINNNKESLQDKKKRYKENYNLVRGVIQLGGSYNFLTSTDAYFQHIVFDHTKRAKVIGGDKTVSSIDIKTTNRFGANRNFDENLKLIDNTTEYGINTIRRNIKSAIDKKNKQNNTIAPKISIDTDNQKHQGILTKLYIDTLKHKNILRDKNNKDDILTLNPLGEKYYSDILSSFYNACDKKKFLGATWEDVLFKNDVFSIIRNKLKKNKTLSTEEICDFISYILTKDKAISNELPEEKQHRHKANGMKINAGNQLRAMLFDEQKYNYFDMKKLTEDFGKTQNQLSKKISEENNIDTTDIYTERRSKDLFSMGSKELRRDDTQDELGSKTWFIDKYFHSKERDEIILGTFKEHIQGLKDMYTEKRYTALIDDIENVNKFKKGEIIIKDDSEKSIEKELHTIFGVNTETGEKDKKSYVYEYKIDTDHINNLPIYAINGMKNAIKSDKKKTGGNGPYADIKVRVRYRLQNNDTGEIIEETGGYEHQIVNMNSHNEGGLSHHALFLDTKKVIVNTIRSKSNIGLNEFSEIVSGGLKVLIEELGILQEYLTIYTKTEQRNEEWPPFKFVKKQFEIRNKIPQELFDLTEIKENTISYMDLDRDANLKGKIEQAVERYLLNDLFESNMIHRFFYENDTIGDITEMIKSGTQDHLYSNGLQHSYILNKGLNDPLNNKYGICGGGSNNLCNGLRNGTYSSKGYIGIKNNEGVDFYKVTDLAGILADCTYIKDRKDIKIEEVQIDLYKTLQLKEKTSS